MKTLFYFLILVSLLVCSVSAMTISPVRFNESVNAGDTVSFDITLTSTIPEETSIGSVEITGDCREWVRMNTDPAVLPATFQASGDIPITATNGRHRCDITFIQPSSGMVTSAMAFPITFNVINGAEPTPTPTPITTEAVPTLTEPSISAVPTPSSVQPVQTSTPLITLTPEQQRAGYVPILTGLTLVVGVLFVLIGFFWYNAKKQERK